MMCMLHGQLEASNAVNGNKQQQSASAHAAQPGMRKGGVSSQLDYAHALRRCLQMFCREQSHGVAQSCDS